MSKAAAEDTLADSSIYEHVQTCYQNEHFLLSQFQLNKTAVLLEVFKMTFRSGN